MVRRRQAQPGEVRRAVEAMGATVDEAGASGVDFSIGELPGYAQRRGGQLHLSIVVEFDLVPANVAAAQRFVAKNSDLLTGGVEIAEPDDEPGMLAYVAEVPLEDVARLEAVANLAMSLHADWLSRRPVDPDATALSEPAGFIPATAPEADSLNHVDEHEATGLQVPEAIARLVAGLGASLESHDDGVAIFAVDEEWTGEATIDESTDKLRIRMYLPSDDEQAVVAWAERQPAPRSGLLQVRYFDDDCCPRLLFERPLRQIDWSRDPLVSDVDRFLEAWLNDSVTAPSKDIGAGFEMRTDPRDLTPSNAWLLKGTTAAFPHQSNLEGYRAAARVGIHEYLWTTAPQTRRGDLVLAYSLAPRKAVHFVARAASDAFFSRDIEVNADNPVNDAQWWCELTPPVEVRPISVDVLRSAYRGQLALRGRSGLYLRPDTIAELSFHAAHADEEPDLAHVIQVPIGSAELPDPALMSFEDWRQLAAGALRLEAQVSQFVVEPLLRLLMEGTGVRWERERAVGRRWADYVLFRGEDPIHVIEVKKVMQVDREGRWQQSADVDQVRWYANALGGVPATLIDSHHIVPLPRDGGDPPHRIDRRHALDQQLAVVRHHLLQGAMTPELARGLHTDPTPAETAKTTRPVS